MKVPQLARYNGTVYKAYEFVNDNVLCFPIDLFKLSKNLGWKILTYEQMAKTNNCTIEDICNCLGPDGYSIYNGHNYIIAYNNTINSIGRINFTLAHEIGHIVLKHHKDFEITSILQNNSSESEYKILENEANCFARNLLAPAPLVKQMSLWDRLFSIGNDFAITASAAKTRLSFLKNDLYYLNDQQIQEFQDKYKSFKTCDNCRNTHLNINNSYCPLCGNKKLVIGDGFMIYKSEIEVDDKKKAKICPKCGNEEILEGDYCKICGLDLYNRCTNYELDNLGNTVGGCGEICDSNARYCHKCGSTTTYYANAILCDYKNYDTNKESTDLAWKEIINNIKNDKNFMLYSNLINTELSFVDGDTVCINFIQASTFSRALVSKEENINILKESIKKQYGYNIKLNLYDLSKNEYFYEDRYSQNFNASPGTEFPF